MERIADIASISFGKINGDSVKKCLEKTRTSLSIDRSKVNNAVSHEFIKKVLVVCSDGVINSSFTKFYPSFREKMEEYYLLKCNHIVGFDLWFMSFNILEKQVGKDKTKIHNHDKVLGLIDKENPEHANYASNIGFDIVLFSGCAIFQSEILNQIVLKSKSKVLFVFMETLKYKKSKGVENPDFDGFFFDYRNFEERIILSIRKVLNFPFFETIK